MGLVVAWVLVGPAWWHGELAASPGGEVYGHAWVQGWVAQAWPALPGGTSMVAGAESWPVIDPLPTWLAAGIARAFGTVAGWNALVGLDVVLAAVGGGALARAAGGVGLVGAVGLATAPILLGSLTSGLTEDGAFGLVALALAALLRPSRRWLGGLLLGLSAWCGLYLAWMGGLAALAVGGWDVASGAASDAASDAASGAAPGGWALFGGRGPARARRLGGWAVAGALAVLVAAPAVRPFAARLQGIGHHNGAAPTADEPLWRLNPWRHADALSFVTPGKVDRGDALVREHPTYVGGVTVALALLGGGGPLWLGAAAVGVAALGDDVAVAGHELGPNPAGPALSALPLMERLNHHARLWLLGQLALTVLASRGAARLVGGAAGGPTGSGAVGRNAVGRSAVGRADGGRVAVGRAAVGIAIALDVALLSPLRVPLPGTPAESPTIYAAIRDLPDGPVVVDGASGPGIPPQKVFYDQRAHGRRLLHDPNRPGPVAPPPGSVLVALGSAVARDTALRGPPDRQTDDGAAWWIPP